jgi:Na+-driven multidrug efflux pump
MAHLTTIAAPNVSRIAWPIFGELLLQAGATAIATWLLSLYSEGAAVAVNTSFALVFFFCVLGRFVTMGAAVVVTQYLGAGDKRGAFAVSSSSLACSIWMGLIFSVLLSVSTAAILDAWSFPPELRPYALTYLRVLSFILVLEIPGLCLLALLRAYGHARAGLQMNLASNALQLGGLTFVLLALDGPMVDKMPLLACVALFARGAFVCGLWLYQRSIIGMKLTPERMHMAWPVLKPALAIGVPAAAEHLAYQVAFFAIMKMIGELGATALIAQGFVRQVMSLTMLPGLALGLATEVVIGYKVGAGDLAAAGRQLRRSLGIGMCISGGLALLAGIFAAPILGLFTSQQAYIDAGVPLLRVGIALETGRCINLIVINSLRAAGDVQFPFRIAVLSMWGLSIPLAWLLGMQTPLALTGVWIAYAADEWVRGLGNLWRWRRGYWRGYAHEARARIEAGQAA